MPDQLQEKTTFDAAWFLMHPLTPFRFRPASDAESRIAGVQDPEAISIVTKACSGDFVIVASGKAAPDGGAVQRFVEALGLPAAMGAELAAHLPRVRPDTLALAAAHLMRSAPGCEVCSCGVRWTAMLAGLASESAPAGSPGLAELEAEWLAFKTRAGPASLRMTDTPVIAASAALREIGRTAT